MTLDSPGPRRPTIADRAVGSVERLGRVWADEYDTIVNWPSGRRHLLNRAVIVLIVDTIALLFANWLLPSVRITSLLGAFLVTIVSGALTFLLRPAAFLVLRQGLIITATLTVLLMGLTLWAAAGIVPGVENRRPVVGVRDGCRDRCRQLGPDRHPGPR